MSACVRPFSIIVAVTILGASRPSATQPAATPLEAWLPAETVAVVSGRGMSRHEAAYRNTALCKVLSDQDLRRFFDHFSQGLGQAVRARIGDAPGVLPLLDRVQALLPDLWQGETTLAFFGLIDLPIGPMPTGAVIVRPAGDKAGAEQRLAAVMAAIASEGPPARSVQVAGRAFQCFEPFGPKLPLCWGWVRDPRGQDSAWLATLGPGVLEQVLAAIDGRRNNLLQEKKFRIIYQQIDAESAWVLVYVDVKRLLSVVEPWLSPRLRLTVNALDFGSLQQAGVTLCFRGRSLVLKAYLHAPGPRRGVMAQFDQKPLRFDQLAVVPPEATFFYATRWDLSRAHEGVMAILERLSGTDERRRPGGLGNAIVGLVSGQRSVREVVPSVRFQAEQAVLNCLGDLVLLYNSPSEGLLVSGLTLCLEVKDPERLTRLLDDLASAMAGWLAEQDMHLERTTWCGMPVWTLRLEGEMPLRPTLGLSRRHLFLSPFAQAVKAGLARSLALEEMTQSTEPAAPAGTRPTVRLGPPAEFMARRRELPAECTTVKYGRPAAMVQFLLGAAPLVERWANAELKPWGLAIDATLLPPAAHLEPHLFGNIGWTRVDAEGVLMAADMSVPAPAGVGDTGTTALAAIGWMLLEGLAEPERVVARADFRARVRTLGLAVDLFQWQQEAYPRGSRGGQGLAPSRRLSWLSELLPYVGHGDLAKRLDDRRAWDDPYHDETARLVIDAFVHPSWPKRDSGGYAVTHVVGLAGVGADGPRLGRDHARAGVFAYDRTTRPADIRDGTSNTILALEARLRPGPWLAAGRPTVRPLVHRPYLNGPDGFGHGEARGVMAVFADGSVRVLAPSIAPEVLEALVTIGGGEPVTADSAVEGEE